MTGTDSLTQAVRRRLGVGRLLPLGTAGDGTWITEHAAAGVLRSSVAGTAGLRVEELRIAGGDQAAEPSAVPAPPSALPHAPVRLQARCALRPEAVLAAAAAGLRGTLTAAASGRLGLLVEAVDVHVAGLLDTGADPAAPSPGPAAPAVAERPGPDASGPAADAARAAVSVPGVLGLAPVLGGALPAVTGQAGGDHVQLELAVAENLRALDVARTVRAAVGKAVAARTGGPVTVAVLVTAVAAP